MHGKWEALRGLVLRSSKRTRAHFENEKGLEGRPFASVKIQKQQNATTTTAASSSPSTKRQYDVVDLTKPDFEDFEAMMLKKMAEQPTVS